MESKIRKYVTSLLKNVIIMIHIPLFKNCIISNFFLLNVNKNITKKINEDTALNFKFRMEYRKKFYKLNKHI